MMLWMLDTNAVSHAVHKRSPALVARLSTISTEILCVSSISYAETRYGQANRPQSTKLAEIIEEFFREIAVRPWTRTTAEICGNLRADMRRLGRSLQPLDMLIAAHALEVGATLVSSDRAFRHVPGLSVEDWTQ